jgi:hypothetical protein
MNTRLAVDQESQLTELREMPSQPPGIRWVATFFSYVLHPVFIPAYITWFMVYQHPYLFIDFNPREKMLAFMQGFAMFTFFPIVTVLLLKALDFISNFKLPTQRDRIIPFVMCMIWYFWIWYVWRNLAGYPKEASNFALAVFISSSIGLMANIYMKVSLHAIAAGLMAAFMLMLAFRQDISLGIYISIAFFAAGLVCTSRLLVSDHTAAEIYIGLLLGVVSMVLANWLG